MSLGQDINTCLGKVKSVFTGDDVRVVSKSPFFPFGLAASINNSLARDERVCGLRDGHFDVDYIVDKFVKMLDVVRGKKELFQNPDGEEVWLKQRSRWNPDYDYGGAVGRKLSDQVKGLRFVSHLILTIDPKRMDRFVPHWWLWGVKVFSWIVLGLLVGGFLEGLRKHLRSRGRPWSFVSWVIEPHESGFPHVHLMFLGSYIADLPVLVGLWPYSEPNGVRLGRRREGGGRERGFHGSYLPQYLSKYLSKDMQVLASAYKGKLGKGEKRTDDEKERLLIAACVYFFKRRLFNCRHCVRSEAGEMVWVFAQRLKREGKWRRVNLARRGESVGISDDEIDPAEYDLARDGSDPCVAVAVGVWSGNLSRDLKVIASMPVLYPEQVKKIERG